MLAAPMTSPSPGQSIRSLLTCVLCVMTCPQATLVASAGLTPIVNSPAEAAATTTALTNPSLTKEAFMFPPFGCHALHPSRAEAPGADGCAQVASASEVSQTSLGGVTARPLSPLRFQHRAVLRDHLVRGRQGIYPNPVDEVWIPPRKALQGELLRDEGERLDLRVIGQQLPDVANLASRWFAPESGQRREEDVDDAAPGRLD